ncbi:hypothetical protein NSK_007578 [Nannochloropsis salina CCMP1776]|jgi:hypothetical protein|uniref:Uncharacterized protein n=1 Tax=Nannochloropsis salina CCMP1776 TaxID=1027361 RepID=A0A4D9CTJ6_9STRA|nr:hypothetical protein NSK_007578 [Nannochloropsis salina CCMP1776]|eukprot:TFJ80935.1 hypothetical protein NSK_007578 [Nannochloropsis salina CCMP1776]
MAANVPFSIVAVEEEVDLVMAEFVTAARQECLIAATRRGDVSTVAELLEQDNSLLYQTINRKTSLLVVAVKHGHHALCEFLIRKGVEVNKICNAGLTAVHHAAMLPDSQAIPLIHLLVKHGAHLNPPPHTRRYGWQSPLHLAVEKKRLGAVRELVAMGSNIFGRNGQQQTPLALCGQFSAVAKAMDEGFRLQRLRSLIRRLFLLSGILPLMPPPGETKDRDLASVSHRKRGRQREGESVLEGGVRGEALKDERRKDGADERGPTVGEKTAILLNGKQKGTPNRGKCWGKMNAIERRYRGGKGSPLLTFNCREIGKEELGRGVEGEDDGGGEGRGDGGGEAVGGVERRQGLQMEDKENEKRAGCGRGGKAKQSEGKGAKGGGRKQKSTLSRKKLEERRTARLMKTVFEELPFDLRSTIVTFV